MKVSNCLQFHFGPSLARSQSAFVHAFCGDDFSTGNNALYSDRSVLHCINPDSGTYLPGFVADSAAHDRLASEVRAACSSFGIPRDGNQDKSEKTGRKIAASTSNA